MSKVVQVGFKDVKKSQEFPLESLQKVDYFQSRFSGRWDNSTNNEKEKEKVEPIENNNNNKEEEKKKILEQSICDIEHEHFTIDDLIVLIEQIVEKGKINSRSVSYEQLPSIVMCADYLGYKIDPTIITTFLCKIIPIPPRGLVEEWEKIYTTEPYQALITITKEYFQNIRTLTEKDEKELLRDCINKKKWSLETWFISDKIFLEIFTSEMKSNYYVSDDTRCRFIWNLLCREEMTHLWGDKVVSQTVWDFLSSGSMIGSKFHDLGCTILLSIIRWGLQENPRYLNMPKDRQILDSYVRRYLEILKGSDIWTGSQKSKELIELAINQRERWEAMTTIYIPGTLIRDTMSCFTYQQDWLLKILKRLNSNDLKEIRCAILKFTNEHGGGELLKAVKEYFL